jgi:hypothetical protein
MRRFLISFALAVSAFAATAVTIYADHWPSG